jgi:hypothetical protein
MKLSHACDFVIASCCSLSVVSERLLLQANGEPMWRTVIGWIWVIAAVRWCLSRAWRGVSS